MAKSRWSHLLAHYSSWWSRGAESRSHKSNDFRTIGRKASVRSRDNESPYRFTRRQKIMHVFRYRAELNRLRLWTSMSRVSHLYRKCDRCQRDLTRAGRSFGRPIQKNTLENSISLYSQFLIYIMRLLRCVLSKKVS